MIDGHDTRPLEFDEMVDDALRGVVRTALTSVSEHGFTAGHHFYVTFHTDYPGVDIPDWLRARHPDEMTIVLQHQYWGLEVTDDWFAVTLSFSNHQERLHVPLKALTSFADPSVRFGLQFRADADSDEHALASLDQDDQAGTAGPPGDRPGSDDGDGSGDDKADKVITLDAFRKK